MTDTINNPPHYARAHEHPSEVECICMSRAFCFSLGNAIKYLYRAGSKGDAKEDYAKAAWYLRDTAKHVRNPAVFGSQETSSTARNALRAWSKEDPIIAAVINCTEFGGEAFSLAFACMLAANMCDERAK